MPTVTDVWWIGLVLVVGCAGVYLLLPQPRPYPFWSGVLACGLALLLAGWFLIRTVAIPVENILFYTFSFIAVVSGGLLVTHRDPVHAALSFALVVLSTCGLFLLQAAPFLMAATIIVYAGAIVVTFLFVIMLAQQAGLSDADQRSREPLLASIAGFVLLGAILFILARTYQSQDLTGLDGWVRQTKDHQEKVASLAQRQKAANPPSTAETEEEVGKLNEFLKDYSLWLNPEPTTLGVKGLRSSTDTRGLNEAIQDARAAIGTRGEPSVVDWGQVQEALAKIRNSGSQFRLALVSLRPPEHHPLSGFSGPPSNSLYAALPHDAEGGSLMPADNVAHLGRSLFTDYLLAVELAGTLLLVATIGAIAIAGRRTEGLR